MPGATVDPVPPSSTRPGRRRLRRSAAWAGLLAFAVGACDGSSASPDAERDRTASVYTAIVDWFADAHDDDPTPLPVFVEPRGDGASVPLEAQAEVVSATADLATVRFIDVRDEALTEVDGHLVAADDGVLLRLPPVDEMADPVIADVDVHLRDAQFLTLRFEVRHDGDGWVVVMPPEQVATPEDPDQSGDADGSTG